MTSKLASLLTQDGKVPARRMADAFQRQVIFGGSLDTILLEMGIAEPQVIYDYLARAAGIPFSEELPSGQPGSDAVAAVARGFNALVVERFHALPIRKAAGKLRVMLIDPPELEEIPDLEEALGVAVEPVIVAEYRFHQAMEVLFGVALAPRFVKLIAKLGGGKPAPAPAPVAAPAPAPAPPKMAPPKPAAKSMTPPPVATPPAPVKIAAPSAESWAESAGGETEAPPAKAPAAKKPNAAAERFAAAMQKDTAAPTSVAVERTPPPIVTAPAAPVEKRAPAAAERLAASFARGESPKTIPSFAPIRDVPIVDTPLPPREPPPTGARPVRDTWPIADRSTMRMPPVRVEESGPAYLDEPEPEPAPSTLTAFDAFQAAPRLEDFVMPPASTESIVDKGMRGGELRPAPVPTLPLDEGLAALHHVDTRDDVFEILCRMARDRFAFTSIFAVQSDRASVRMALGPAFLDPSALTGATVDLELPSPLRTAVQTMAPFIGKITADDELGRILGFLGRPLPSWCALLPVVLRERCVAVLVADDEGQLVAPEDIGDLVQATAEASHAFLRIIQAAKRGSTDAKAAPAGARAPAMPSGPPGHVSAAELARCVGIVEREEEGAGQAAATLLAAGDEGAASVFERFPGPLRFGHRKLNTVTEPLSAHGPLLGLSARFGDALVPSLIALLDHDPSADLRFYSALVLGEIRSEAALPALGDRLFDPDAPVRRAAAFALSRHRPSMAMDRQLELVRQQLESPDQARLRCAAFALGELRDVHSLSTLVDLLKHRDAEVVDLAQRALLVITKQDFGAARWRWRSWWEKARMQSRVEWLLGGLEQPSVEARRSAAEELVAITTDRFGFHAGFDRREREEASRRFAVWSQQNPAALS